MIGELRKSIEGLEKMQPALEKSAAESKAKLEKEEKARSESTGSDIEMLHMAKESIRRASIVFVQRIIDKCTHAVSI